MKSTCGNADSSKQSRDSLFDGQLICYQHKRGYRFSLDAVLLAHFIKVRQGDRILDLGAGCGIISLIVLYRYYHLIKEVCAVEIQQTLAHLAEKNMQVNEFSEKSTVINGDVKESSTFIQAESYHRVLINPPFYTASSGRINIQEEVTLARHQIRAELRDFLSAAAWAVKNKGSVYCIYPAEKNSEFINLAMNCRLAVKRAQYIYSYPETTEPASLVMFHCLKNGGPGTKIMPPFFVYKKKNGSFTREMQNCYRNNKY